MPYMAQGSSKGRIICPSVRLLTTLHKIFTVDFSTFLYVAKKFLSAKTNAVQF